MTHIDKDKFGPWAIVTGASSGIGKEFARQLAASGLNVVLVARRLSILEEIGRELAKEYRVQYRIVGVDLTNMDFLEKIEEVTHDLDIGLVIGNAGAAHPGEFLTLERNELLQSVSLKIVANLSLVHHYGRKLARRRRGGILLVSSTGGLQGIPYVANNAATEAYVLSLGEALHIEFQKLGLNMTVLLPGPTETPSLTKMGIDAKDMPVKPMSAEQCAAEGLAALNANQATHIAGRMNRLMAAVMPRSIATNVMGRMIGQKFAAGASAIRAAVQSSASNG